MNGIGIAVLVPWFGPVAMQIFARNLEEAQIVATLAARLYAAEEASRLERLRGS